MITNGKRWWWIGGSGIAGLIIGATSLITFHRSTVASLEARGANAAVLVARVASLESEIRDFKDWRAQYLATVTQPRITQMDGMDRRLTALESRFDVSIAATRDEMGRIREELTAIRQDLRDVRNRLGRP